MERYGIRLVRHNYIVLSSHALCGRFEVALRALGLRSRTLPLLYLRAWLVTVPPGE